MVRLRVHPGLLAGVIAVATLAASVPAARAQRLRSADEIEETKGVELDTRLGERVPLDLVFTNDAGEPAALREYFDGETPVLLSLVYYSCPVVCPTTLEGLTNLFNDLDYDLGADYRVLVVSFNPDETTAHAYGEKMRFLPAYRGGVTPETERGWVFHTGSEANSARLADAVGFRYKKLPGGEYSHPVTLTVLTGDGRVSHHLDGYGVETKQLKLALLDASDGAIAASIGDRVLAYCYRFDPTAGKYSVHAMSVMRLGGGLTVLMLGGFIGLLFVRERARKWKQNHVGSQSRPTPLGQQA